MQMGKNLGFLDLVILPRNQHHVIVLVSSSHHGILPTCSHASPRREVSTSAPRPGTEEPQLPGQVEPETPALFRAPRLGEGPQLPEEETSSFDSLIYSEKSEPRPIEVAPTSVAPLTLHCFNSASCAGECWLSLSKGPPGGRDCAN